MASMACESCRLWNRPRSPRTLFTLALLLCDVWLHRSGGAWLSTLYGGSRYLVAGGCGLLPTDRQPPIHHPQRLETVSGWPKRFSEPCVRHIDRVLHRFHPSRYAPAPGGEVEHPTNIKPRVASHAADAQHFDGSVSFESFAFSRDQPFKHDNSV